MERDDMGLPLNFGGREAKLEAKREKAKETWHAQQTEQIDKKMNETFGKSLNRASAGYRASLAAAPNQANAPQVATAQSAALVAQASGKMQVNPARLAMITGQSAAPPPAGINPARLALINGQQPSTQPEPPPSEPPVPVPVQKKRPEAVVLSEEDARVMARMENKQWKTHREWGPELLQGGPIGLVVGAVEEAGVARISLPDLKGALQAKTQSAKVYNTLALKKYVEHFPEALEVDSEDTVMHTRFREEAQLRLQQEQEMRARVFTPGVEVAAVQQWKKEGTGIWARKELGRLQLKVYFALRDLQMRKLNDLTGFVRELPTDLLEPMVEFVNTDACLLGSNPETISYSQWQLAEDVAAANFLMAALQKEINLRAPPERAAPRSRSPPTDRGRSPDRGRRRQRSRSPGRRRSRSPARDPRRSRDPRDPRR